MGVDFSKKLNQCPFYVSVAVYSLSVDRAVETRTGRLRFRPMITFEIRSKTSPPEAASQAQKNMSGRLSRPHHSTKSVCAIKTECV